MLGALNITLHIFSPFTVAEEDQDCFFKSIFRISDFDSEIKFL